VVLDGFGTWFPICAAMKMNQVSDVGRHYINPYFEIHHPKEEDRHHSNKV